MAPIVPNQSPKGLGESRMQFKNLLWPEKVRCKMNKVIIFFFLLIFVLKVDASEIDQLTVEQLVGDQGRFECIKTDSTALLIKTKRRVGNFECVFDDGSKFTMFEGGHEYAIPLDSKIVVSNRHGYKFKFLPLQKPLKGWGYRVEFSNGDRHRPQTYSCFEGNIVFLGQTPDSKFVVTPPTLEAAMDALKEAGIDPGRSTQLAKKPVQPSPTEYGILKMEDLIGEKGIFERIEIDRENFYLKFKESGDKYIYSINYLKPLENKPGEEIAVPFCGRFNLSGNGVSLTFIPIPDKNLVKDGFYIVKDIDLNAAGKGLLRIEGYLIATFTGRTKERKNSHAVVTFPAISAALAAVCKDKWDILNLEYLYGGNTSIADVTFDGTSFFIKIKSKFTPKRYEMNGDLFDVKEPGKPMAVPIGSSINPTGLEEFHPLPEPLRAHGLDVRINSSASGYREGFLLFTGREKDGKPEAIMTEPFLPAAIAAFEKAKQEGK